MSRVDRVQGEHHDGEREREPAPQPAPARQPPGVAAVLDLQRHAGNRAVGAMLQRMRVVGTEQLGDIVEFEADEELPKGLVKGKLDTDPDHDYLPRPALGERKYVRAKRATIKKPQKADDAELERRRKLQLKNELVAARKPLFGADQNGGTEGTFEYVANYLFDEVFDKDRDAAQAIWDELWEVVEDPPDSDPRLVRNVAVPAKQKQLLKRMINIGLDATWNRIPIQQLQATTVNTAQPAKTMPVLEGNVFDYFSALYNWTPWPETSGVGFHTTDGAPSAVAKAKAEGGWGGITRPITVPFFQKRYALDAPWNPLGTWLDEKGPTFRQGIKDNELLSTVSVATALHGSIRFPLADKKRKGTHGVVKKGAKTFQMEAYIYAVSVREGFATFARQGANAFGEIATGDIPIQDIIGWSKITRWHNYENEAQQVPATAEFTYTIDPLNRNPAFPAGGIYDRLFAAASVEIGKEIALSSKPYTSAS